MMFKSNLNETFDLDGALRAVETVFLPIRVLLWGKGGVGKTTTAVEVALGLVEELRKAGRLKHDGAICIYDTEMLAAKSLRQYAGLITTSPWHFFGRAIKGEYLSPQDPRVMAHALNLLGKRFDVVILDSISAAWACALNLVDEIATGEFQKRPDARANKAAAWSWVTPIWDELVGAIRTSPAHIIGTVRGKDKLDVSTGRSLGAYPVVRSEFQYEVDHVGRIIIENGKRMVVFGKGRHQFDGATFPADEGLARELGAELARWLSVKPEDVQASSRASDVGQEVAPDLDEADGTFDAEVSSSEDAA